MTTERTNILKIDKATYTGYLWYSDTTSPKKLDREEYELELNADANPFVIEGQLFDGTNSISVKYVDGSYIDGSYIVTRYSVPELDCSCETKEELSFLPNRMEGISSLKFRQYWEPEKDDCCENMAVLRPTKLVFVGFEKDNRNAGED